MVEEYRGIAEAALRPVRRVAARVFGGAAFGRIVGGRHSGAAPPRIADLGVIGDRRTAAVITPMGEICWFSPGRFDAPSFLNTLIDPDTGGTWKIRLANAEPASRRYVGNSAILETRLLCPSGELTITDWMPPAGVILHGAICRRFGPAPDGFSIILVPGANDGRAIPFLQRAADTQVVIDRRFRLQASHPVQLRGATIHVRVPRGDSSWAVLTDNAVASPIADAAKLEASCDATLETWETMARWTDYDGPYARDVRNSLRALRLLTYEPTGAMVAAATTSLPEIIGGKRNFDYRFSWLRDSGMVIRGLIRFDPQCREARQYLAYVAGLFDSGYQSPLDPISAVGGERVPKQRRLRFGGYRNGRPNLSGNAAARQLQLGSLANFVLAANEIYTLLEEREHWDVVRATAETLCRKWRDRDNGIWEEKQRRHYTSSLALTACALERIAMHTGSEGERWRAVAGDIRRFIERACRRNGVFMATTRSSRVDISAALFPTCGYIAAEDAGMTRTIEELDRHYCVGGGLYHRHLQHPGTVEAEGAFLAGTFWVAHYWAARKDARRAHRLIEQGLSHANDLGLFPEEIDTRTNEALGNFPLGLVHGSFLSAVADLWALETGQPERSG